MELAARMDAIEASMSELKDLVKSLNVNEMRDLMKTLVQRGETTSAMPTDQT